jgi:predicted lipid-binding transport protein (Tim44 family)
MTQNSSENQLDLNALVSAANRQVDQAADAALQKESRPSKASAFRLGLTLVLVAGLLALLFTQANVIQRQLFGVSQATMQAEAQTILTTARAAVEEHHKLTGKWPDRVPLAALDALVAYQNDGISYQLKLVLNGKTWQMDHYGTISGE